MEENLSEDQRANLRAAFWKELKNEGDRVFGRMGSQRVSGDDRPDPKTQNSQSGSAPQTGGRAKASENAQFAGYSWKIAELQGRDVYLRFEQNLHGRGKEATLHFGFRMKLEDAKKVDPIIATKIVECVEKLGFTALRGKTDKGRFLRNGWFGSRELLGRFDLASDACLTDLAQAGLRMERVAFVVEQARQGIEDLRRSAPAFLRFTPTTG